MPIEEIVSKVAGFGLQRVSITGGNPLEANGVALLIKRLAMSGYVINIEATGQDFDKEVFDRVDFISCDIKPPSTEVKANLENIKLMLGLYRHKMQIKIVCATDEDLDFIVQCCRELENSLGCCNFVITPCYTERANNFDYDMIKKALNRVMDEKLNIRVIMQQHKLVFGSQRGDV
jgi:7-carboxy-7-deazaguanine synthase